ncbi:hypothetical protein NEUTE1DRAFT_106318 [Neurospora tetrasperma FGSC 2508]|uniref:Uncharacterized protein n=1 Tax=Neurospora tetrasperma (strain FGSC 2508 / ATCC MYA-4615 / P0657) TaxID=510951 RepID=F8N398_NEUT8|nr:uncharacterized protein NEUTE1DRAFT_106318 [Neurospora tetrasperma FGSC 2508]EGO53405.1 hypothetical protein NEUTE1DRAFT_106318 [Neurospora tetrasperma FGSC 2508]
MYYFSRGDFRGKLVGWCSGHVCVAPLLPPVPPGSHVRYAFEPGSCNRYTPLTGYFIITSTREHTLDTRNVASRGHREEQPKRKDRRGGRSGMQRK